MKKTMTRKLQMGKMVPALCLMVGTLVMFNPADVRADSGTWDKTKSGNWSDAANWIVGGFGTNQIADGAGFNCGGQGLGSGVTRTITVDTPRTIGTINMDCNGTGRTYLFTGNTITLDGSTPAQIGALNGNVVVNSVIDGTLGLRTRGRNTGGTPYVYLNAANTYSGNTEIMRDGAARIGNAEAIPHGAGKGDVFIISEAGIYGTLDLLSNSITINGLSGDGGTVTASTSGFTPLLTVGDNNASGSFAGIIQDGSSPLALTKIGTGTETLSGFNTYSGLTTVSGGTLAINGSIPFNVQVDAGGTLGGIGTIGGTVTVAAGGSVGAGASAGTLTVNFGLDLSAGGTNIWEAAANSDANPGTDFDQIILAGGNLDVNDSTLIVKFTGTADGGDSFWSSSHSWTIISMVGGSNPGPSNFAKVVNASNANGDFTTAADGSGNIVLTFTPGAPQAAKPRVTSISGAGTTTVTVNYTNTVPTKSYTLRYRTNLSTTNWNTVGSKVAAGFTDFQTDASATTSQRYYQLFYVAP